MCLRKKRKSNSSNSSPATTPSTSPEPQMSPQLPPPNPVPPLPLPPAADDVVAALPDDDIFALLTPLDVSPVANQERQMLEAEPLCVPSPIELPPLVSSLPTEPDWNDKTTTQPDESTRVVSSPLVDNFFDKYRNPDFDCEDETSPSDFLPLPCPELEDFYAERIGLISAVVVPMSPSAKLVGAGVANLGFTCFMGSILQCFTHTVLLLNGLRSYSHDCPNDAGDFCVFCALLSHMNSCFAPSRTVVRPALLVENLNQFSDDFERNKQEDAHEFMHCALNKLRSIEIPEGKQNLVDKIFGGRIVSKLRCSSCGHSSDTYEVFIDMSLEIENIETLHDALESFTKVEKIDEKLTCARCNEAVSMEKRLLLTQTPSVAVFHLKRFKRDGNSFEKIRRHVCFTLELDLQPYTSGAENENVEFKYDLYAVVVHTGSSPNSGHYYCFVRSKPDKWHRLDDDQVTSVPGDEVLTQEAYILFYARQGTPWFSSITEDDNSFPHSGSGDKGDGGGDEQIEDQHSDSNSVLGNRGDSDGEAVDDPTDADNEGGSDMRVDPDCGEKCDTTHNQVPPD